MPKSNKLFPLSPAMRGSFRCWRGGAGVGLGGLLGTLALLLLSGCASSPFLHPDDVLHPVPGLERFRVEDLWVTAADGVRLHGWDIRPRGGVRGTLVYFHGNAGNLTSHVGGVLWLVEEGYRVFALDYRGFGRSEGDADVAGSHGDAVAFLDAVLARGDVDRDRVAVLGQSFGGVVAVVTVARSPDREYLRLLIVDSSFASYERIAGDKARACLCLWPAGGLVESHYAGLDELSPIRHIPDVAPVPVLIIHGDRDVVVPVDHGRTLYEAASEPKGFWLVQGGRHVGAFGNPEIRAELLKRLRSFMGGEG